MVDVQSDALKRTPLHELHSELGARMVPFAGYDMPVQFPRGILGEHRHVRAAAGLFDVSHMGQAVLTGPDHETVAGALEGLVPGDIRGLQPGRLRYTLLLDAHGGILDDLMVTRPEGEAGELFLVVNAARKAEDFTHLAANLPAGIALEPLEDRALVALQGPKAAEVMARHAPAAVELGFMTARAVELNGVTAHVSRSGYTGEDGFEISVPAGAAEGLVRMLLAETEVEPIGLGARDSLRLEAGLCLYGHDIDETTSPAEADLGFAVAKRRREEGGFPGAARILRELAEGPARKRVGILPEGRAPAREGAEIADADGRIIGRVTSGGFGPSAEAPVAMGYVETAFAAPGTEVALLVRGQARPARIASMPFVPHRYFRKAR